MPSTVASTLVAPTLAPIQESQSGRPKRATAGTAVKIRGAGRARRAASLRTSAAPSAPGGFLQLVMGLVGQGLEGLDRILGERDSRWFRVGIVAPLVAIGQQRDRPLLRVVHPLPTRLRAGVPVRPRARGAILACLEDGHRFRAGLLATAGGRWAASSKRHDRYRIRGVGGGYFYVCTRSAYCEFNRDTRLN